MPPHGKSSPRLPELVRSLRTIRERVSGFSNGGLILATVEQVGLDQQRAKSCDPGQAQGEVAGKWDRSMWGGEDRARVEIRESSYRGPETWACFARHFGPGPRI
jgi:hypothetical protein